MSIDATAIHHLLLEIWVEPRQINGAFPIVRARVRDLETGRQRYVKSPSELSDFISDSLARAGHEEWRWQGDGE